MDSSFELNDYLPLFEKAFLFDDYTINEKMAKILTKYKKDDLLTSQIAISLKSYDNFYVRRYFV